MSTTTLERPTLKTRAVSFLENTLTHKGTVLAVRVWEPAAFYEVDVHLPQAVAMDRWRKAQHIKVRVAPLTFRDYTPAEWDAETQTCTLYIDAGHDGPGARWAKSLQSGDPLPYLGIEGTPQTPEPGKRAVFLGDSSAIGQFLALSQLAGGNMAVSGALALSEARHAEYQRNFGTLPLELVSAHGPLHKSLNDWIRAQAFTEDTVFYLAGNTHLVVELRNRLRQRGFGGRQLKTQGFWH